MKNADLNNKLKDIVKEEINLIINEASYKYGGVLDPKDFDRAYIL